MRVTSPPSVILLALIELKTTVRAHHGLGVQVLAAIGAGKRKLSPAVGACLVLRTQGSRTVGTKVYAARGALPVLVADRVATVAAEGCALDFQPGLRFGFLPCVVLKSQVHLCATVGTDGGVGWDLLIALGTIETEFGAASRTGRAAQIHECSTFGAVDVLDLLNLVDLFAVL